MSPEKQRIAIAEACGWNPTGYGSWYFGKKDDMNYATISDSCNHIQLSDYLNDLNAMHDALKVLDEEQKLDFCSNICRILNEANRGKRSWLGPTTFDYINATASQFAQAFLHAIGKWEISE